MYIYIYMMYLYIYIYVEHCIDSAEVDLCEYMRVEIDVCIYTYDVHIYIRRAPHRLCRGTYMCIYIFLLG